MLKLEQQLVINKLGQLVLILNMLMVKQLVKQLVRLQIKQLVKLLQVILIRQQQFILVQVRLVNITMIIKFIYDSLNFSLNSIIFYSWNCFCHRNIFCLLFINSSWNIFCLVFNWIIISDIFSDRFLNLNCLCFHFYYRSLIFSVFNSWFSFNWCWLWCSNNWLCYNWLCNNWLCNNRLCYNRLC